MPSTELITGNTYPVRAEMRALGGTWEARLLGWSVPMANEEKARAIVAGAGPGEARAPRPGRRRYQGGSNYTRFASGA